MKRLAILLPWFSFFLREKYIPGFICLALQISIIGWPIAALWALAPMLKPGSRVKEKSLLYFSRPATIQFSQDAA